jgi:hypothetical protein
MMNANPAALLRGLDLDGLVVEASRVATAMMASPKTSPH